MRPRLTERVRMDVELGAMRKCPTCREWWPDDAEFFVTREYHAGDVMVVRGREYVRHSSGVTKRCRACASNTQRESDRRRSLRQAVSDRMIGYCQTAGCPIRVPEGRTHCHGCAGRTAGTLTAARIRELLHPVSVAA